MEARKEIKEDGEKVERGREVLDLDLMRGTDEKEIK